MPMTSCRSGEPAEAVRDGEKRATEKENNKRLL